MPRECEPMLIEALKTCTINVQKQHTSNSTDPFKTEQPVYEICHYY